MNQILKLYNCPIPPSENKIYRNVLRVGRVYTKEALAYKKAFQSFALANHIAIKNFNKEVSQSEPLILVMKYTFHRSRLFTKKDTIKRLDLTNYQKILLDCISKDCGIDDSRYFEVTLTKQASDILLDEITERVDILISPMKTAYPF